MRLLVFVVLVSSHLLVDAKYVPRRNTKDETTCAAQIGDECQPKITDTRQEQDVNVVIEYTLNECPADSAVEITYTVGETEGTPTMLAPGLAIILGIDLTCQNIEIEIVITTPDGDEYCDFHRHETVPPATANVVYKPVVNDDQKIELFWDYSEQLLEQCSTELTFSVRNGAGAEIQKCETTPCEIDVTEAACNSIKFSVVAIMGTTEATNPAGTLTYVKPLPSVVVRDVFPDPISAEGIVITSFDPLENIDVEKCGKVQYRVEQVAGECFNSNIIVYAYAPEKDTFTASAPRPVNNGPGHVVNAAYELIGDKVNVTWEVPVDGEECDLWYKITYIKRGENGKEEQAVASTHGTYVPVPNIATACTKNPIVVTPTNGVEGSPVTLQVEGELGGVIDLDCTNDDNEVTCIWEAPANTDECEVAYSIEDSTGPVPEPVAVKEHTFQVDDKCSGDNWIKVTPVTYLGEDPKPRNGIPLEKLVDIDSSCQAASKQSSTKSWWKYFL